MRFSGKGGGAIPLLPGDTIFEATLGVTNEDVLTKLVDVEVVVLLFTALFLVVDFAVLVPSLIGLLGLELVMSVTVLLAPIAGLLTSPVAMLATAALLAVVVSVLVPVVTVLVVPIVVPVLLAELLTRLFPGVGDPRDSLLAVKDEVTLVV